MCQLIRPQGLLHAMEQQALCRRKPRIANRRNGSSLLSNASWLGAGYKGHSRAHSMDLYGHRWASLQAGLQQTAALRIDRAAHFNTVWEQQEIMERAAADARESLGVVELYNQTHLDAVVDATGPGVVAICFYSRTCGSCRKMMRRWDSMCTEAVQQRAGVQFLQHDIRTEYDDLSDVARLYNVRATPSFAFLVGGAKVLEFRMRDTRSMTGSSTAIRSSLAASERRLDAALRGVLFQTAPSARR